MTPERMSAADFWNRDAAVKSLAHRVTVEPYEDRIITEAVDRAGGADSITSVVVVGVGAGRELRAVRRAAPNASIVACDLSGAMVDACRRFVDADRMSNVTVIRSAAADLATDRPADVVVAVNAVLGYPDSDDERTRTFRSLHGLLRPGGAIALVVQQRFGRPDWAAWFAVRSIGAHCGLGDPDPGGHRSVHEGASLVVHHYSARELSRYLTRANFADPRIRSLRAFARSIPSAIPLRSPNPLVATAMRAA